MYISSKFILSSLFYQTVSSFIFERIDLTCSDIVILDLVHNGNVPYFLFRTENINLWEKNFSSVNKVIKC